MRREMKQYPKIKVPYPKSTFLKEKGRKFLKLLSPGNEVQVYLVHISCYKYVV